MQKTIVMTIDGPCGSGKTAMAKALAKRHGYMYLDTGAIFRTMALYIVQTGFLRDVEGLERQYNPSVAAGIAQNYAEKVEIKYINGEQRMYLQGNDVTDHIRTRGISDLASRISVFPDVRNVVLDIERKVAAAGDVNIVTEGRDTGSVVFPNADIKIFLTASEHTRAARRYKQTPDQFKSAEDALNELRARDYRDTHRETAPLVRKPDMYLLDNTNMSFNATLDLLTKAIEDHQILWRLDAPSKKWQAASYRNNDGYRLNITRHFVLFIWEADFGYHVRLDGKRRRLETTGLIINKDVKSAQRGAEELATRYIEKKLTETTLELTDALNALNTM